MATTDIERSAGQGVGGRGSEVEDIVRATTFFPLREGGEEKLKVEMVGFLVRV